MNINISKKIILSVHFKKISFGPGLFMYVLNENVKISITFKKVSKKFNVILGLVEGFGFLA